MADVVLEISRVGKPIAVAAITLYQNRAWRHGVHPNAVRHELHAQRSVSKISAALAAPYWPDIASCGDQPEIDATLITAAPGRPFMCGRARRIIRTVWITFRSSAPHQSSSVLSGMPAPPSPPPTLFTRMSMPP